MSEPTGRRPSDAELLDWLEKHSVVIDYSDDPESPDREVTIIHGSVNDRQYTTVGNGPTARAALRDAVESEGRRSTGPTGHGAFDER